MYNLLSQLFPHHRSITGKGIDQAFQVFQNIHPEFTTESFPSGSDVFDWTIPDVWNINNAYIEHESGQRFCEFKVNNLHVVSYSLPVNTYLDKSELISYLYSRPDLPSAIPYVTSYYKRTWGFCISHDQLCKLPDGKYKVVIDSSFSKGDLNLLHAYLPGKTSSEIFFSSYLCHPSMANNELSGPVVLSELLSFVKSLSNRYYSYRFVLLPETIGSIAFLSRYSSVLKSSFDCGYNLTCLGDNRAYSIVKTRDSNSISDLSLEAAIANLPNFRSYSYLYRGSDERQYNSPGIDLPVTTFCRSKFSEYPEYHTSLDNLSLVSESALQSSFDVVRSIVSAFETGIFPVAVNKCEPQLGKRGLYPNVSHINSQGEKNRLIDHPTLRMDLLAYADGRRSIFELCLLFDIPLSVLLVELQLLISENLITTRFE